VCARVVCNVYRLGATALFATTANAFVPATPNTFVSKPLMAASFSEVDEIGNNIAVKKLLSQVEESGLLTKVAQSGLLSKAQDAGISLSKLEPLLALAAENDDVLILAEAATPELLPLLPTIVELAPQGLPLAVAALDISPGTLQSLAIASVAAAGAGVYFIPDDTIVQVAAQTLLVAALGVAAPAASLIGAEIIKIIKK